MANDIQVTISGRAGADPVLVVSEGKRDYARFPLATNSRRRNAGNWEDGPTQWYEVKTWGSLARNVAASIHKGTPIIVSGDLLIEEYQAENGPLVRRPVIHAESIGPNLRLTQAQIIKVHHQTSGSSSESAGSPAESDVSSLGQIAEGANSVIA